MISWASDAIAPRSPSLAPSPDRPHASGLTLKESPATPSSPRLGAFEEPALCIRCLPFMSSRVDMYRQRAADATKRAAQAKDLSVRKAFEEVARGWRVLAEQMEWIDRQRSSLRDENDRSSC
jgi:hypothetical protein